MNVLMRGVDDREGVYEDTGMDVDTSEQLARMIREQPDLFSTDAYYYAVPIRKGYRKVETTITKAEETQ